MGHPPLSQLSRTKLAVLGSPIEHSLSPAIHRAAYRELGLEWSYDTCEVDGGGLGAYLTSRDSQWRGLSLTMPLKHDVVQLLVRRHPIVELLGAANTVLFGPDGASGFNTDVPGVVDSFRYAGIDRLDRVAMFGAGATASSVMAGAAQLGVRNVTVFARSPHRADALATVAAALDIELTVVPWSSTDWNRVPDAVIATVPGSVAIPAIPRGIVESSTLFDVAYDPWPSSAAIQWKDAGSRVISGHHLLVSQALGQVRVFVHGDPDMALPDEARVLGAMRAAIPGVVW